MKTIIALLVALLIGLSAPSVYPCEDHDGIDAADEGSDADAQA